MRRINKIAKQIEEELEGAKHYAEKYVEYRIDQDTEKAVKFKEMAMDELKHAMVLHEVAVEMIEATRKVIEPPAEMMDRWQIIHDKYIKCMDETKRMISSV